MDRKSTGKYGEDLAKEYLRKRGYTILARNWKCKLGEIDIVSFKSGAFVFVEVKTLRQALGVLKSDFNTRGEVRLQRLRPEDHMTFQKQQKVMRLAEYYLAAQKRTGAPYQIDLIAVEYGEGNTPAVRHIERVS